MLFFVFACSQVNAQSWSALGGGTGWVNAMTVYNGELIVGTTTGITKWDGNSWTALGSGISGTVEALCVYNGKLYAGGGFALAGGLEVGNLAAWDGTAWSDPEGGTNGIVSALCVYDSSLIVGGYFTDANGSANYIARWDDHNWFPLGSGMGGTEGQVMEVVVYNNDLYAGGFFTTAGGVSANHVAKWNGTTWSALGSGTGGIVYTLGVYNGSLIAGGLFLSAGGSSANAIASWNGSAWSAMGASCGGGLYPYVMSLTTFGNDLYVAGLYKNAGGQVTNGIAKWDGTSYSSLNGGMWHSGNVCGNFASTVYNGELVCGGIFQSAGGVSAGNIAAWGTLTGINNSNANIPNKHSLSQNYPNPFNPTTNIKYNVYKGGFVKLTVFDALGREVETLVNQNKVAGQYEVSFNASKYPSGVYFYKLQTNDFAEVKKMILSK